MSEDDQTESETKKPRTRGTQPTDRQTMTASAAPAAVAPPQQRMMPWDRGGQGGGGWGQPPMAAPNGNTGVVGPGQGQPMQAGGHPAFQWGGGGGQGGMPNWQALAQQFQQRFAQNNPFLGRTGQQMPPGQAPAAPPQGGMPPGQPMPGRTPPFYAGPQAAQGMPQPGAAPQGQGGPLQARLGQLAQMFGRQQPGGIVGPGQGPQNY